MIKVALIAGLAWYASAVAYFAITEEPIPEPHL